MKKILLFLSFLIISCSDSDETFIVKYYHAGMVGSGPNIGYIHDVYINKTDSLSDSSYITIAQKYKDTISVNLPLAGIMFVDDTSEIEKTSDDIIENLEYCRKADVSFNYSKGSKDFGKLEEINYWKKGWIIYKTVKF